MELNPIESSNRQPRLSDDAILSRLCSVLGELDGASLEAQLNSGIFDSFDLINVRISLEQLAQRSFSDEVWLNFNSLTDIIRYLSDDGSRTEAFAHGQAQDSQPIVSRASQPRVAGERVYDIEMPQMALGGLSESWFFKEIGDMHWNSICTSLNKPSNLISDGEGNRLYATFVRIRWESSEPLSSFLENDVLHLSNSLSRFGRGMYFSTLEAKSSSQSISAHLMSTFTQRVKENTSLLKGEPQIPANYSVPDLKSKPSFAEEYSQARKGLLESMELGGERIEIGSDVIFSMLYDFNPYYDFNGVNLLYFAAYPIISNHCERFWFNFEGALDEAPIEWTQKVSTLARDIFYFGNCNITDQILFELNQVKELGKGRFFIQTSLRRKSDGLLICRTFKIAQKND